MQRVEIGFLRKEIVAIVAFVILFIGRLTLSVVGFDNQLFQSVLRNIITIAFIVPLIELLKKVKIQKRFLIWLGTIHHVTMNDYRIPSELYKAKGAKVIWGPMGGAQVTPRPLKVYEKNQLVASFREFVNKSCSWNPFYKKALRSYYKIYCINNETQKQISRIVGKDVPLMPELALRDEYKNLPIRKGNNDILKIVFVGRLIGKKGIAFLVDALSLMPTDMNWELLIFGDGDDHALIEKQIADSGIGKNVKLMGNRPLNQIAEAYQQADVFVLPSLRETSGNVLLEAMAYAVPIVAFDTSFCRLLKEVDCGVFVNTDQALEGIKEDWCNQSLTHVYKPDRFEKLVAFQLHLEELCASDVYSDEVRYRIKRPFWFGYW